MNDLMAVAPRSNFNSPSFPTAVGRSSTFHRAAATGFPPATGAGWWLGKGIDVGRFVVGDDQVVVENVADGQISLHIPSGEPLVAGWQVLEDLTVKITAALLVAAVEADRVEAFQDVMAAVRTARRIRSGCRPEEDSSAEGEE